MITPIENNGMVLRTQDFSVIRHNEENQSSNQQGQIQSMIEKTNESNVHTVRNKDNSDGADTRHDAREEGRNKYVDMRKKKGKTDPLSSGVVVAKGKGGFDITI